MRVRRSVVCVALALVSLVVGAVAGSAPASAATSLPVGFGAIAVDPATGKVFVSSPDTNVVTVLDSTGAVVATITGQAGATSLLVDAGNLFVANTGSGTVDVFDTASLAPVTSLGGGSLVRPNALAIAGGKLWTTTGTCGSSSYPKVVSIDVGSGATTVHPALSDLWYCPTFVASPTDPNLLVAFNKGLSPATLVKLDVSSGVPVRVLARHHSILENLKQIAFSPDGQTITTASGAPYEIDTFQVSDLAQTGTIYATGNYPNAVAVTAARGGLLAAGRNGLYSPDVDVFRFGQPANRLLQHDYGTTSNTLWDRGLAFSPDGSRLYTVTGDTHPAARTVAVNVHSVSVPTATTLASSANPATAGTPITFTATVGLIGGGVADTGTVTFRDGATVLGTAPVVAGTAVATSALAIGSHPITASFTASGAFAASTSATLTQTITAGATTTSVVSSLNPAKRNTAVTFTATVAPVAPATATPTGTVTFKDGTKVLGTGTLTGGTATYTTSSLSVGTHAITVVYAGDASSLGSTSAVLSQTITKK